MVIRLVLVRHGLSSYNKIGLIQGRTNDSYLTEEGYQQALLAGNALKKVKFDKIFSSPLKRASETAVTIENCFEHQTDIKLDENLLEVNLENWSGYSFDEIKQQFPDQYKTWKANPEDLLLEDKNNHLYYPIKELFNQADRFIENIINQNTDSENKNILVVAHNAILRCLILTLINKPQKGFRKIKLDNASISILNLSLSKKGERKNQVECLNQTAHLNKNFPDQIGDSRIFLVRHGETNWNKEGRFQGQIDIPLNDNGRKQAQKASVFLENVNFTKAYASDMSRPFETAKIILGNAHSIEINKIDKLREISHGLWEGKLETEIKEKWSELLDSWHQIPSEVQMPEGESINQVSERSITAWNNICESQDKDDITLLVAHDAVNKTLLCNILGLSCADIWMIKQGNGGISVIDIFKDSSKNSVISALNITTHLGSILDSTASGAL